MIPLQHSRSLRFDCRIAAAFVVVLAELLWSGSPLHSVAVVSAMTVAVPLQQPVTHKPHILSVGVAAVDFVATVEHYPVPNEKMRTTSLLVEGGGNAANTACAIGRLADYASSSLLTAIGDDPNGATIQGGLVECQVHTDTTLYTMVGSSSPFTYIIVANVDGDSTRTCLHQPASGQLDVNFVQELDLVPYTALHFDGRYPAAAVALAERCCTAEAEIPYSLDVERPRDGLLQLLANATVVICNADYCRTILGSTDSNDDDTSTHERLRRVISEQAPRALLAVQTLGSQGACLIRLSGDFTTTTTMDGCTILLEGTDVVPAVTVSNDGDGALYCDAFAVDKVVDTTGAGDAFQGGFLTALWTAVEAAAAESSDSSVPEQNNARSILSQLDDRVLGHALRIGARVAAQKVQQPGARRGLPSSATDVVLQAEFAALQVVVAQSAPSAAVAAAQTA
jgi:sugar/nucleoside kinase (ribokinase family)